MPKSDYTSALRSNTFFFSGGRKKRALTVVRGLKIYFRYFWLLSTGVKVSFRCLWLLSIGVKTCFTTPLTAINWRKDILYNTSNCCQWAEKYILDTSDYHQRVEKYVLQYLWLLSMGGKTCFTTPLTIVNGLKNVFCNNSDYCRRFIS